MVASATKKPIDMPVPIAEPELWYVSVAEATASFQLVERALSSASAKNVPATAPTTQPTMAIRPPSSSSMRRTRLAGMPTASRVPVSRVRFSIVNWNSSEISITAAAMRKKLNDMNS